MKNKKQRTTVRSLARETVHQMSDSEKLLVKDWAQKSLVVVSSKELSRVEKVVALRKMRPTKPVIRLFLALLRAIKEKSWTNQSWARRLGIGGLTITAVAFGSKGAGIAAFGTAQGLPLFLVTATGATALGAIIDEINKERK